MRFGSSIVERFCSKFRKGDPLSCWDFRSRDLSEAGHPRFWIGRDEDGKNLRIMASWFSWELFCGGPVPEGMCVLHHCDNPKCVNPSHLFLGTRTDNSNDKVRKGRQRVGKYKRLSKEEREELRILAPSTRRTDLAEKFGITTTSVYYNLRK